MSAPNQGRQSPEPEQQSASQKNAAATNVNDQGAGPKEGSGEASKNQLSGLESNPVGVLEKEAEKKTSKE